MAADDAGHDPTTWSELRQAHLPAFEARLYRERGGLEPAEAVEWWERYVLSSEAAAAIAAGWSIEDAVVHRKEAFAEWRAEQERERAEAQLARAEAQRAEQELADALREFVHGRDVGLLVRLDDLQLRRPQVAIRVDAEGYEFAIKELVGAREVVLDVGVSLAEALEIVAGVATERGLFVASVRCRQIRAADVLEVSGRLASAVDEWVDFHLDLRTQSGERRVDSVDEVQAVPKLLGDEVFLTPMEPSAWPEFVEYSATSVSVGKLFLTTDIKGRFVPVGYFENVADGIAACQAAQTFTHVVEVTRKRADGNEIRVSVVLNEGGFALLAADAAPEALGDDLLEAFRRTAALNKVDEDELTTITLGAGAGVSPADLGSVLLLEGALSPDSEYVHEFSLPDEFIGVNLYINAERWAWTRQNRTFVCFGGETTPRVSYNETWAYLSVFSDVPMLSGTSTYEMGLVGDSLVIEVRDIDDAGFEIFAALARAKADRIAWIIDWTSDLSDETGLDIPMLLAEVVLAPGVAAWGAYHADELGAEGSAAELDLWTALSTNDTAELPGRLRAAGFSSQVDAILAPGTREHAARLTRLWVERLSVEPNDVT